MDPTVAAMTKSLRNVEEVKRKSDNVFSHLVGGRHMRHRGMLVEITFPGTPASQECYDELKSKFVKEADDTLNTIFLDVSWPFESHLDDATEQNYFNMLANLWKIQQQIKELLEQEKIVVVLNYTYSLACYALTHNLFQVSEMREPVAIGWCFGTFKGLMIPDMTIVLTESLSYIESQYKKEVDVDGYASGQLGYDEHWYFHASKLYITEDTKLDYVRFAPCGGVFGIANGSLYNAILLSLNTKLLDVKPRKIKLY